MIVLDQIRQRTGIRIEVLSNSEQRFLAVSYTHLEVKIETGKKVFDRDREKEKIAKVKSLTHTDFNKTGIGELLSRIHISILRET